MNRDYTYGAKIQQVRSTTSGMRSGSKGEAEESERLEVTVTYDGTSGASDSFVVSADHRDEFVIGREAHVILRLPDVPTNTAAGATLAEMRRVLEENGLLSQVQAPESGDIGGQQ